MHHKVGARKYCYMIPRLTSGLKLENSAKAGVVTLCLWCQHLLKIIVYLIWIAESIKMILSMY